jgi:hydroxyethylthiazole kinase-like uncharacterized protein yjeF
MPDHIDSSGFNKASFRPGVTLTEMKEIEDSGEKLGISKLMMMENAGSNIARFLIQNLDLFRQDTNRKLRVIFVAGVGNNGGDAFVAARQLAYWKESFDTAVILIGNPAQIRVGEAKTNYSILEKISQIKLILAESEPVLSQVEKLITSAEIMVVGIFGTGFKGEPRELQSKVIQLINENSKAIKISIDIPSGMEADSGNWKTAVSSDYTITMHAPKKGMNRDEVTRRLCGEILIANIGVPL